MKIGYIKIYPNNKNMINYLLRKINKMILDIGVKMLVH